MNTQYINSSPVVTAFVPVNLAPSITRHAIIISDVLPEPTSAASLTMHRHLVERGGFRITQVSLDESQPTFLSSAIHRRLRNSRLHRWVIDFEFICNAWNRIEKRLPSPADVGPDSFVFTLAHGNGCWAAERYAKQLGLPLVVRFDDWWPDMIQAHSAVRARVERAYRNLYRSADCAICISEGMRDELGGHPNARVIVPIPRSADKAAPPIRQELQLRVGYLGNMNDYGPMLAKLVEAADGDHRIRIEFRGSPPRWPIDLVNRLRSERRLHCFAEGAEFQNWFESFHVYLVAMFFESQQRRRVETCFSTKLTEYCSLGRPIVIWAPESAAIVKWAKQSRAAVCVTNQDPLALVDCLHQLARDPMRLRELGQLARKAYETDFLPEKLQRDFLAAIDSVL